jgi:hypothetical protein
MANTVPKSATVDLCDLLTGDEDARVCREIPEAACREQPRHFFIYVGSLVASKTGDCLASPKLVEPSPVTHRPSTYFLLNVAHAGVRVGRKTHLIDIATPDNRARYVAVSNTFIGIMLIAGGAFGAIATFAGVHVVARRRQCGLAARQGPAARVSRPSRICCGAKEGAAPNLPVAELQHVIRNSVDTAHPCSEGVRYEPPFSSFCRHHPRGCVWRRFGF